jgi:hypothetical protein
VAVAEVVALVYEHEPPGPVWTSAAAYLLMRNHPDTEAKVASGALPFGDECGWDQTCGGVSRVHGLRDGQGYVGLSAADRIGQQGSSISVHGRQRAPEALGLFR